MHSANSWKKLIQMQKSLGQYSITNIATIVKIYSLICSWLKSQLLSNLQRTTCLVDLRVQYSPEHQIGASACREGYAPKICSVGSAQHEHRAQGRICVGRG